MRNASLQLRPIRLHHRSNIETIIAIGSRISQMIIALVALVFALDYGVSACSTTSSMPARRQWR